MSENCRHCGCELQEDALFCMKCGQKVVESTCSQCGKALPSEAKFCVYCGQVVEVEPEQSVFELDDIDPTPAVVPLESKYSATRSIEKNGLKKRTNYSVAIGIAVGIVVIIAVLIGIRSNNENETVASGTAQDEAIGYEIDGQTGEISYYPGDCMSYGLFYDLANNRDFIREEVHTNYVTLHNFRVSQLNKYGYIICTGYVDGEWYEVLIRVSPDQMESFIHTSEITAYGVLRLSGDSDNEVYIDAEHVTLYEDAFLTWAISDGT